MCRACDEFGSNLHTNAADDRRRDPTRTTTLRKRFEQDVNARFRQMRGGVNRYFQDNAERFQFVRDDQKVAEFMRWLEQEQSLVLGVQRGADIASAASQSWANEYVAEAYHSGVNQSASKLRAAGADVDMSWVSNALRRPAHAERMSLIYSRVYSELHGITEAMDQQISRILSEGIGRGLNPMELARQINEKVDSIGRNRARMLARTEVIAAHSDATLNSFVEAGIVGVDVEAEWLVAAGACEVCLAIQQSGPYSIQEARGMLPAHPNCRCAWAPVVVNGTGITLR